MKKRVLFVLAEPSDLASLRTMLAPLSDEWEMEFVLKEEEALAVLAQSTIDVILSEIHLTGMGGLQLLTEVKSRAPRVIRIASSSCAHRATIVSALEVAHQFIPMPFTPEVLKVTIARAGALGARLTNESLRSLIAGIRTLPSLPQLYQELVAAMGSSNASVEAATRIISQDMAMVSKLLQVVNSAFFGLRRTISSPAHAIALLGIDSVKSLVLAVQVFSQFEQAKRSPISLEVLWKHGLTTGTSARDIAKSQDIGSIGVEGAFMAGLLHDIGLLVLATNYSEQYGEVVTMLKNERLSTCDAERAVFKASHEDVGAYLLGLWGVSDAIVEAVAFHHAPGERCQEGFSTLAAVHVANSLEEASDSLATSGIPTAIDLQYLTACGLAKHVPLWQEVVGCSPARESAAAAAQP
ncbi:MAG: response regulator [Nitrospirae bacterium]|nr:response regulator [Nitrospirota bacterium]